MYLKGDDDYLYYFAHMSESPVRRVGDRIKAGNFIGYVGQSGNARTSKAHLHFQTIALNPDGSRRGIVNPTDRLFTLKNSLGGVYPWPPPFDVNMPLLDQPYVRRGAGAVLGLLTLGVAAGYVGYLSYHERDRLAANVHAAYSRVRRSFA